MEKIDIIRNRRGFLKVVEAVFAIMIILGVLIFVTVSRKTTAESDLSVQIAPLLDEIAKNPTFREDIVTSKPGTIDELNSFLDMTITNPLIKHAISICEPPDNVCAMSDADIARSQGATSIYAGERIISSILPTYSPKKVKIFLWISK